MALWLFKEEPDCYSFAQLEADGRTYWEGVANPQALKHLRSCAAGDRVFFYHTGKEKAIVGVMEVTAAPVLDVDDPTAVAVPVKPVRRLAHPVTLATIKADTAFAGWELVKQARLSVMPVPPDLWAKVEALAEASPAPKAKKASKPKT